MSSTSVTERSINIDILKTIGLLAIILAHVEAGNIIFQLRNFDVPLMVMCSGILFALTASQGVKYPAYIKKRLIRLVVPSWIFLLLYFSIIFIVEWFAGRPFEYDLNTIMQEFFLRSKVVGLWIIRVFIYVAFTAPLFLFFWRKWQNIKLFLVAILLCYFFYELIFFLSYSNYQENIIQKILSVSLYQLIPYSCIFALGFVVPQMNSKSILFASVIFLGVFVLIAVAFTFLGKDIWIQLYKYPPRTYYLAYALGISLLLYYLTRNVNNMAEPIRNIIIYFSSSSLWIYLWHWLFLHYVNDVISFFSINSSNHVVLPLLTFMYLILASAGVTYLQKKFWGYWSGVLKNKSPNFQRMIEISFL